MRGSLYTGDARMEQPLIDNSAKSEKRKSSFIFDAPGSCCFAGAEGKARRWVCRFQPRDPDDINRVVYDTGYWK